MDSKGTKWVKRVGSGFKELKMGSKIGSGFKRYELKRKRVRRGFKR